MSKFKIGDVVSLDLPDNTYLPLMGLGGSSVRYGGLSGFPREKTFNKCSNIDKFTIVEVFDGSVLATMGGTNQTVKIPTDKIAGNAKKIRERLGIK